MIANRKETYLTDVREGKDLDIKIRGSDINMIDCRMYSPEHKTMATDIVVVLFIYSGMRIRYTITIYIYHNSNRPA